MIFRDTLERSLRSRPALRFAPPPPTLTDVAGLLLERHGEGDGPRKSPEELEALLERLRVARFDWDSIRAADRFDVAWVLWDGPEPPAEHEAFLAAFLHWVETPWRRFQARRIAGSWVDGFDPRLKSIRVVGAWLAARASQLLDPWPGLAEELDIFSLERAPAKLAGIFLAAEESERACCDRVGLTDRTAAAGLRLEALGAAAALVQRRLVKRPGLAARLMELSLHQPAFQLGAASASRASRVRSIRVKLAEALLLPWQHDDPAEDVTEQILFYLLRHYGDPWLTDALWGDMRPLATSIMRRWFKKKAIASFFRLAGRKTDSRTQTQLRQEFWMAYIDRIDDAWLVGGPQSFASMGFPEPGYGRLVGCRPDHCALLLKLGGMTIVETSHAQNERVWLADNELAPPLYHERSRSYCPTMLTTGADFSSGYGCNDGRNWQERLHSFIERRTRNSTGAASRFES
jgi:hypothetical protein